MNILHILNGDATATGFEDTGLDGDIMIWRAMLSEGPVEDDITSGRFWRNRLNWIGETLNEPRDKYQQIVLNELTRLDEPYDEINLWFEFDLHCQVNLLGIMTYMKKKTDLSQPAIFLISPGDFPGKENFRGMGELNGEELEYLYDNIRVQLSTIDFIIAEEVWNVYVTMDAEKLSAYLNTTTFWGSLHLLKPALEAHLNRLSVNAAGFNYIEQKLLDIYNSGNITKLAIYAEFWKTEKIYGMGDMEINLYLGALKNKIAGLNY